MRLRWRPDNAATSIRVPIHNNNRRLVASITSQFSDPRLDELVQYWLGKRGSRTMPARTDIRPAQMGSLLRLLNLIEVDHHPLRFRHRLVGSETILKLGRDATGRCWTKACMAPRRRKSWPA